MNADKKVGLALSEFESDFHLWQKGLRIFSELFGSLAQRAVITSSENHK
jgi:hypothetical protein